MITLFTDEDEWYPVFTLRVDNLGFGGKEVNLTSEEYQDYLRVMKEFDDWQIKIKALDRMPGIKKVNGLP
jgi:hypothetical protein